LKFFFKAFEQKYNVDIGNKIQLKLLNYKVPRSITDDLWVLNRLVENCTCDIVVVMTDRDHYSPIRVSSAVNALKRHKIAIHSKEYIYSYDSHSNQLFTVKTGYYYHFTAFLAFHRDIFVNYQHRFHFEDSIYGTFSGLVSKNADEEISLINDSSSYIVLRKFIDSNSRKVIQIRKDYSYPLKHALSQTEKNMKALFACNSSLVTYSEKDECPVCFNETNYKFRVCKHTICDTCVDQLIYQFCPMCRDRYTTLNPNVWNIVIPE